MGKLAAVILAAGVSSRMGNFKPMLTVGGETMIRRVVFSMLGAGADPVVVVTGYKHDVLEQHLSDVGVTFVHNARYYETQMLDSLLLGLSALPDGTDRVLVTPADIPLVKPETVQLLLSAEGDFIRPCYQGTPGHPVVMSSHLQQQLREFQGLGGLHGAIQASGITPVDIPVEDYGTTLDGDTRDEYARLLQYHRQDSHTPQPLQLDLRIGLHAETAFWGPDCAQFLELVQTSGSMLSACQCMHMSYSRGWRMINEIERQLGYPLLIRSQGGSNGGGSQLTPAGKQFLSAFQQMQEEIQRESQSIFSRYFPDGQLKQT